MSLSDEPIRVPLVDDHEIVCRGIWKSPEPEQGIEAVRRAGVVVESLALARRQLSELTRQ